MNTVRFFVLLLVLCTNQLSFAQDSQSEQVKALNNYVQFTNESTHGMLIVHRMLENFNQEVNKYVDLQSNKLNFYGNSDLPSNIFKDPEHWFYEVSPYDYYKVALKESSALPVKDATALNESLERIKKIIDEVNNIRFQIDQLITDNDLTQMPNQTKIYGLLENCVDLYDGFYAAKETLSDNLYQVHNQLITQKETKFNTQINDFSRIHGTTKSILERLHFGGASDIVNLNTQLKVQIDALQANPTKNRHYDAVLTAARAFLSFGQKYITEAEFPSKYSLYGKEYYYYNVELVSCFNRYGSGLVKNINAFITLANPTRLALLEEPHFYKVIYPKKTIDLPHQEAVIDELPASLEERSVVVRQQVVQVDEEKLLLEIYDHRQADGDIISLNFNGNWILKDKQLEKRPIKLLVDLNKQGENYIVLHAQNLGDVPPNTIAIRYYFKGIRKHVILNSDLNESEMIRLELVK